MGSYTKLNLLLITIVAMCTVSFASESIKTSSPVAAHHLFSIASYSYTASPPVVINYGITSDATFDKIDIHQNFLKLKINYISCKKKFKRATQVLQGLKLPVKNLEDVAFNIYINPVYSRPHFLSHLHYFLFRLTPF